MHCADGDDSTGTSLWDHMAHMLALSQEVVSDVNRQFDVKQMIKDAHKKPLYERIGGEVSK